MNKKIAVGLISAALVFGAAYLPVTKSLNAFAGTITANADNVDGEEVTYLLKAGEIPGKAYWGSGHAVCINDFYRCLESGKEYPNSISSVENTMKVMCKAYEKAGMSPK